MWFCFGRIHFGLIVYTAYFTQVKKDRLTPFLQNTNAEVYDGSLWTSICSTF